MRRSAVLSGLILLLGILSASSAGAQGKTHLRVDGERIKSYIGHLSTDEMMGRQSMTPGYQKAAEWVAAQYQAWGLQPAGDNGTYFQKVPIGRNLTWYDGTPSMTINGNSVSLVEGDFSIHQSSTVGTAVEAEVVFVGYGISAPGKGLDEYAGVDVRGKVALALLGSPKDAAQPGGFGSMAPGEREEAEPQEEWLEESKEPVKIRTAMEKGALAILLFDPDPPEPSAVVWMGRRNQEEVFEPTRDFLTFTITERTFRSIMKPDPQESVRGFATRLNAARVDIKYGSPQSAPMGVIAQLKGYDFKTEYNEELGNNYAYNVLAKLPGTDRDLSDEYVVMGGHLDHLGMRNGQIYNGADDNASGTAVAMEVARVLSEGNHRPGRTVIFAAWCGEEMGLIGSNHFVSNPPDGVDIDKVVTYFNMDMVGLGDAIGAPGALNFPTVWDVITRDQDQDVMAAVRPRTGGPGGSDHSAFVTRGIEALALMTSGGEGHPYYHQPEDDTEKIDPEILRKTGQLVLQGTINLAAEREVDLLIDDRQLLYNALMFDLTTFNPGHGDHQTVMVDAATRDELVRVVLDSALVVTQRLEEQEPESTDILAMMRRRGLGQTGGKKSFARGVNALELFGGDTSLLLAAAEFVGFGRLDVAGDDGYWFSGGHLTAEGREALEVMEENEIWLHLANPSQTLFEEVLTAASKPFIVTGDYSVSAAMAQAINEKGVILGIEMDPSDLNAAMDRLEDMKVRLGDTDNLVLSVTTEEGVDEARQALYLGLAERGWEHTEIAGDRRAGGGIGGGALRVFSGAQGRVFRMR